MTRQTTRGELHRRRLSALVVVRIHRRVQALQQRLEICSGSIAAVSKTSSSLIADPKQIHTREPHKDCRGREADAWVVSIACRVLLALNATRCSTKRSGFPADVNIAEGPRVRKFCARNCHDRRATASEVQALKRSLLSTLHTHRVATVNGPGCCEKRHKARLPGKSRLVLYWNAPASVLRLYQTAAERCSGCAASRCSARRTCLSTR